MPSERARFSPRHYGLFFDLFASDSAWIRESARISIPPLTSPCEIKIYGDRIPHPEVHGMDSGIPGLTAGIPGLPSKTLATGGAGIWEILFSPPPSIAAQGFELSLNLTGVRLTNFLAWAGRILGISSLQRFRAQNKNRQLRIQRVEANGEVVFDFSNRHVQYSPVFARKHVKTGMNIVGFFKAYLGVGESARCMLRAADAAIIPAAAVPLKLHCKALSNDDTYEARLQDNNPYPVNVFHLDAPASGDIDYHHGKLFCRGKYNIGYWAWELPDFPDAWLPYFRFFDEIWCPSDFVRQAIADKSPLPVVTMPHAIAFERPTAPPTELQKKFNLPADKFLFLFVYDLNSYSERKNPRAALEAFRLSGLSNQDAALVIKLHGVTGNEAALTELQASIADLPGVILITSSLARTELYELEAACDCFVSLHRSEGFGIAVAECMYLGKPVIATNWSATAEYLDESNGCPVRCQLITLTQNHGPYSKGQTWADPDITHAAEWMKRLCSDRETATRLGRAARETIEARFSPAVIGARYRHRLETIASW